MKLHEDSHTELDELRAELHQLERRVAMLEHREPYAPEAPVLQSTQIETAYAESPPSSQAPASEPPPTQAPHAAIPVVVRTAGRAILGLAGAFLLRAVAESNFVPQLIVVIAAIIYGVMWLGISSHIRRKDPVAAVAYSITSAFILAPLLWEATVRFKVLPPVATAAILVAYVLLGTKLPWTGPTIVAVTTLAAIGAALGLMVQTGDLVPFAAALLLIAAIAPTGKMRVISALSADFAVWLLIYIATRSGGVPPGYQTIGLTASIPLCSLLFLIFAVRIVRRTVVQLQPITVFEIFQIAIAFALSAGGAFVLTQGHASAPLGSLCAIGAAACYFIAYMRFAEAPVRNHHVFAYWGAALGLIACYLILPEALLIWIWSAAAVVATLARIRIHGAVYLLAAAIVSSLPMIIFNTFTNSTLPPVSSALWIVAVAAVGCYVADILTPGSKPLVSLIPALFAAVCTSALLLSVISPSPTLLATVRTLVICVFTLVLAYYGSRTAHSELTWISYAGMAVGALKLFAEDFRTSPPAALAVALICYGSLLILIPKLRTRSASKS